jgi:protein O-GlcNAc transferase
MPTGDQHEARAQLQKGTALHRAGQLGLAQSHYQRAAKLDPDNAEAWHLLGVVSMQGGNLGLAIKHLQTSVKVRPGFAEAHNNLGVALSRSGRHAEAVAAFQTALKARGGYAEAMFNMGIAYEAGQVPDDAERAYRQTLAWRSNHVDALINLGNLLRRQGRRDEALPLMTSAQQLAPGRGQTNGNLALLLDDMGRHAESRRFATAAVALEPESPLWRTVLGSAQRQLHDIENAIASLNQALALDRNNATAALELALALEEAGDDEGARTLRASARPAPSHVERVRWLQALSLPALYRDDAHVEAAAARFADGLTELQERVDAGGAALISETAHAASTVTSFYLNYQPRDNTTLQCRFGDLIARVMAAAAPELVEKCTWRPRTHGGRVRVGFVSSHLMEHSVSRYFTSLVCGLDPQRFDARVWYTGTVEDASTRFIAARVGAFVRTPADELALAREIREAQCDVLVYPEIGMDPKHQALAGLRLAPVQCVLYGHPVTSGAPHIDYFLSGAGLEPDNAERHYRERLIRLPGIGTRPQMPPPPGDAGWLDALVTSRPVLLCLQNVIKLPPSFDTALARIAEETDSCIAFFIRNPPLMQRFRARIEAAFRARGTDPGQYLAFLPVRRHADYVAGIARTPLVLDSPWFSGGSTSLDAFSVGTPVLAWEGSMARGRQTSAMLRAMELGELIASGEDDYAEKAAALIRDRSRLDDLRRRITANLSAIFHDDAPVLAFAEFLESVAT